MIDTILGGPGTGPIGELGASAAIEPVTAGPLLYDDPVRGKRQLGTRVRPVHHDGG